MEQLNLKQLVEKYPEVLTDSAKLKAYILDLYPDCKHGMLNILITMQQCGIVAEMRRSSGVSQLEMRRWKKVMEDDYGYAETIAETCLQMWYEVFSSGNLPDANKNMPVKTLKNDTNKESKLKEIAIQSTVAPIPSDLQNSQSDWFVYEGTVLIKIKKEHELWNGIIYIPDGVTCIGDSAFYNCSRLASVMIPKSVTSIGNWAFYYCSELVDVTIPDSVTNIGTGAFAECSCLMNITIPDGVTSIGKSVFLDCSSLTTILIPDSVTSIGPCAFHGCCSLTSITIPNGVKSIGTSAFWDCPIEKANIPMSIVNTQPEAKRIYKQMLQRSNTGQHRVGKLSAAFDRLKSFFYACGNKIIKWFYLVF